MAGTNLLGAPGVDRLARMVAVASPFVLWPRGRRWLRDSGMMAETAMVLAIFAGAGHVIIRGLVHATDAIDRQQAVLFARHEVDAALTEDETVRRSVIERTTHVLEEIRGTLATDRPVAVRLAAEEELRLRAWIADRELPVALEASVALDGPAGDDRGPGRTLSRFVVAAWGVLRLGAGAQMVFESITQHRPREVRLLAALAAVHAVATTVVMARGGHGDRRLVTVGDLAMVSAATAVDVLAARGSRAHGWTAGYVQAVAGSAGAVSAEPVHTVAVAAGLGAVVWVGGMLHRGPSTPEDRLRTIEEASLVAATVQLSGWFRRLVVVQAERLDASTRELARQRSMAAAAEVRRHRQFFLHDSALQVLLWVQKQDLTDRQLEEWIDRELRRLRQLDHRGRRAEDEPAAEELWRAFDDLLAGFASLGIRPQVHVEVEDGRVPPAVLRCMIEVCNEALANVLRHSEDREPRLRLSCSRDELELEVVNVVGDDAVEGVAGTGRRAMLARAGEVGGTVEHRCDGCRYVVSLRVRLRPRRHSARGSSSGGTSRDVV
jgi:signal transduction histidine kinase